MRRAWLAGAILALTYVGVALADTITKTDGTVIEGEVVSEDADSVTIKCKLGELKIPLSEVAKVSKGPRYDADAALAELKAATLAKLREIEAACEDAQLPKKAKAAFDLEGQVRAWSLSPTPASPQAAPSSPPAVTEKPPVRPGWAGLELGKTVERWYKVQDDARKQGLTTAQMQKALDAVGEETEGKIARGHFKLTDTRPPSSASAFAVTCTFAEADAPPPASKGARPAGLNPLARMGLTFYFDPGPDRDWFEKQPKGVLFRLEGVMAWQRDPEGAAERHYRGNPTITECKLVK